MDNYETKKEALLRALPHLHDTNPNDRYLPDGLARDSKGIVRGAYGIPYARWTFNDGNGQEFWYTPDANSSEFIAKARDIPLALALAILQPPVKQQDSQEISTETVCPLPTQPVAPSPFKMGGFLGRLKSWLKH